ncbi:MAG: hypothetical protein ACJ77A_11580 [Actinomycetota bacterium]
MRRTVVIVVLTVCSLIAVAAAAWAASGGLDHNWSGDGRARATLAANSSDSWDLALQGDGKVVVVGTAQTATITNWNWGMVRYRTNGTLDTAFGGGDGKITTAWTSGDDEAYAVKILPSHKILVAGQAGLNLAIARYTPTGHLDTTFGGGDGKVVTDISAGEDAGWDIELLPGGQFLVGGEAGGDFAVVEYGPKGGLRTSFGNGGIAKLHSHNGDLFGREIAVQASGKILETGFISGGNFAVAIARFTADGHHDTTFGGDNTGLVVALEGGDAEGWGIEPLAGGSFLVAGYGRNGNQTDSPLDAVLLRFTKTGQPDASFGGGDGIVFADLGGDADNVLAMAALPDGKLLLAGSEGPKGGPSDAVVAKLKPNGTLDHTFSGDGVAHAGFPGSAQFWGIGLTQSTAVVATGYAYVQPDPDTFATARFLP